MLREAPMAKTFRDIFGFLAILLVQFIGAMTSCGHQCIMRQACSLAVRHQATQQIAAGMDCGCYSITIIPVPIQPSLIEKRFLKGNRQYWGR